MKSNNILHASKQNEEDLKDKSIRPHDLDEFVGQKKLKDNLRIFTSSAKKRKKIVDHVLFYGPPGLGKTTLAQIVAKEMEANFRSTSGPIITKAADLAAILTTLSQGDVLFIDEIHRLSVSVEEVLYSAMEDFKIDVMIGEGPSARTVKITLPKFTLIGATTRMGLLSKPLIDRFGIPMQLDFYETDELASIILRATGVLEMQVSESAIDEIAKRSRGTPRIAIRLLRRVVDFGAAADKNSIDLETAKYALNKMDVDNAGLDKADIKYLEFIAHHYNGGPVGIETIAAAISDDKGSIEETIEPFLIRQGFVNKTPRGRVLTTKATNHIGLQAPYALTIS